MNKKHTSEGQQEAKPEKEALSPENQVEKPPAYVPPATREKRQRSVVH